MRPLRDHLCYPGAAPGQLPHWLAVLRPRRRLHLPAGPDVVGHQLRPDSLPPPAPLPPAFLRPDLSHPQPRPSPHSDLAGGLRLALHQVSRNTNTTWTGHDQQNGDWGTYHIGMYVAHHKV